MNLKDAFEAARWLQKTLKPFCARIAIAGSIRRQCKTVNDIELVCIPKRVQTGLFSEDIATDPGFVKAVNAWKVVKGEPTGKYTQRLIPINGENIVLDLFMTTAENWGMTFALRTGSADYSHYVLAKTWTKKGCKSEEGILLDEHDNARPFAEEEDLFRYLGIDWVPPQERDRLGAEAKASYYAVGRGVQDAGAASDNAGSAGAKPEASRPQPKGNQKAHEPGRHSRNTGHLEVVEAWNRERSMDEDRSCWTCCRKNIGGSVFPLNCLLKDKVILDPERGCENWKNTITKEVKP